MRAIDADAIRARHISAARYFKAFENGKEFTKLIGVLVKRIDEAPTIDYAPVVHGEWIEDELEYPEEVIFRYKCSECGRTELVKEPYCHCGARMDGGEKEE